MLRLPTIVLFALTAQAIAQDRGLEPRPHASNEPLYGRVYSLCIASNEYPNAKNAGSLTRAEAQLDALSALFEKRFGYAVKTFKGEDATKDNLRIALEEYERILTERDALVIHVGLHGDRVPAAEAKDGDRGYLIPCNAKLDVEDKRDRSLWERETIDMKWLAERCKALPARHVLIIVDSCCSGFFGTRGSTPTREDHRYLIQQRSRVAITAGDQTNTRSDGTLTEKLLKYLTEAETISAMELFARLREDVAHEKAGITPQYRILEANDGEFIFIPIGATPANVSRYLTERNKRALELRGTKTTVGEVLEAFEALDYRYSLTVEAHRETWTKRLSRFLANAKCDDPLAMAALYYCYSKGLGTEKDAGAAYTWARRASDTADPLGRHVLAACYLQGVGVTKNEIVANALLEEAATNGSLLSRFRFAKDALNRAEVTKQSLADDERERVLAWLREGAAVPFRSAQTTLAFALGMGLGGIEPDRARAFQLLTEACEAGHPEACFRLATVYGNGLPGVAEKDLARFRALQIKAANDGFTYAQLQLGIMIRDGKHGFEKDETKGREWFEMAAAAGEANAMVSLVNIYALGQGVPQDWKKAASYLEKAVALDHPNALFMMGAWYNDGKFYDLNPERAISYFERAGEKGVAKAWFYAGKYYEDLYQAKEQKLRNPEDAVRAAERFLKGAELGDDEAKDAVKWWRSNRQDKVHAAETRIADEKKLRSEQRDANKKSDSLAKNLIEQARRNEKGGSIAAAREQLIRAVAIAETDAVRAQAEAALKLLPPP